MQRFKIKTRDQEIQRIATSVAMLATVFKEVADMVIDQGTLVDRIDYNMEQVSAVSERTTGALVMLILYFLLRSSAACARDSRSCIERRSISATPAQSDASSSSSR